MANGIRGSIGIDSYIARARRRLYGEISCWEQLGESFYEILNANLIGCILSL